MPKKIRSALISVFHKEGLNKIIPLLIEQNVTIYSTGGTQRLLESFGAQVKSVEQLTGYPSILDGRVKTLHPKVFGGILARDQEDHNTQLGEYEIPRIDLVIVDLYPFEETVRTSNDEAEIIEKIDIGGVSLIRAAAKNYRDVVVIPSQDQYEDLHTILEKNKGQTDLDVRKKLALSAFYVSSHYDTQISEYLNRGIGLNNGLRCSVQGARSLRYGENPHQEATFYGDLESQFEKLNGKALSYNNLVDVDSAVNLMEDFQDCQVTFAILKHTNSCGIATRNSSYEAYLSALAGDPISAFGGILICNGPIDLKTATEIDKQFYEVLIAPKFETDALALLSAKKNRIILVQKPGVGQKKQIKTLLNGVISQSRDIKIEGREDLQTITRSEPSPLQFDQLLFANKVAKHLKSNTIVLAKDFQLIGMGCGQTSRVDACIQALGKAKEKGFDLKGAVMASDAFFPFPDCVELANAEGISSVIQPGGSRNDQMSIDYCNEHGISMVFTNTRHFKH